MNHPSIDYVLALGVPSAMGVTKVTEATNDVQLWVAILGGVLLVTRLIDWGIKIALRLLAWHKKRKADKT